MAATLGEPHQDLSDPGLRPGRGGGDGDSAGWGAHSRDYGDVDSGDGGGDSVDYDDADMGDDGGGSGLDIMVMGDSAGGGAHSGDYGDVVQWFRVQIGPKLTTFQNPLN